MSGAGKATVGVDFGTESARAVLVDVGTGRELATAVHRYASGVIDQRLPGDGAPLAPDWALQDPDDYLDALGSTVRAVLAETGIDPSDVIGIGIDFTACTMLPVTSEGIPLCRIPELRPDPHSWVKLWKHHAAQPEADLINETAEARGDAWLDRYGRRTSSEWFFAKALQILDEAPAIYARADRLIEAADWVVWQLTGVETRNSCTAGYKALWSKQEGFPGPCLLRGPRRRFRRRRRREDVPGHLQPGRKSGRHQRRCRRFDRAERGHARGRRQRRCPRLGSRRDGGDAGLAGGGDGHQHLSSRLGRCRPCGAGLLRRRGRRRDPGPLRLRGGAGGGRRHVRLVRRDPRSGWRVARRAAPVAGARRRVARAG